MIDKIIHKILDVFFLYIFPVLLVLVAFILAYRLFDFFILRNI